MTKEGEDGALREELKNGVRRKPSNFTVENETSLVRTSRVGFFPDPRGWARARAAARSCFHRFLQQLCEDGREEKPFAETNPAAEEKKKQGTTKKGQKREPRLKSQSCKPKVS